MPGAAEDLDIIVGLSYSVGAGAGAIVRAVQRRRFLPCEKCDVTLIGDTHLMGLAQGTKCMPHR